MCCLFVLCWCKLLSQFITKCLLDNAIFIRYLNYDCLKPLGACCCIVAMQYVVTHIQWPHNSVFSVDLFSKSECLSFDPFSHNIRL